MPFSFPMRVQVFGSVALHQYLTDPYTDVTADFEGAPSTADSMVIPVGLGQTEFRTAIGFEVAGENGWSGGFQYTWAFSEHADAGFWSLGFTKNF